MSIYSTYHYSDKYYTQEFTLFPKQKCIYLTLINYISIILVTKRSSPYPVDINFAFKHLFSISQCNYFVN